MFDDVVSTIGTLEVPCVLLLMQEKTAKVNTLKIKKRIPFNLRWNPENSCAMGKNMAA